MKTQHISGAITQNYKAILEGMYSEGDTYWEKHDNIIQAVNRLIELDQANHDGELNIGSFKITLEKE